VHCKRGNVHSANTGKKVILTQQWGPWLTYLLTYLITYLLTYYLTYLLTYFKEQLTGLQLVKKFPSVDGTRRFITAFTNVRHLSRASSMQSIPPHPTSWRSILVLFSIYTWVSPMVSFPQVSPPKSCTHLFPPHPRYMPRPSDYDSLN
jgi:hypothetical protein